MDRLTWNQGAWEKPAGRAQGTGLRLLQEPQALLAPLLSAGTHLADTVHVPGTPGPDPDCG